MISGQSDNDIEANLLPDLYRIRFQINHFHFLEIQLLFTDRALPTIRHGDQILEMGGWGGGGVGGSITITLSRPKITVAYAFISSRFCPSLTGLAWL